ncbi:TRAP transporter large permease [Alteribacillus sp. YIM 98480]|uniref:TRAP transporter large permease n=1 Tax=Alteribacillus sp. YIM 98480 TaxID=2606599 RepID=UPI00131A9780|nr:TRAP transporter large permease [Alteribacillus sp. YIM 98480]
MGIVLIIALFVLFIIGVPIAISLGMASSIAVVWSGEVPLNIIIQRTFTSMDSFPLMAVPFFILAGKLMETGGISKRLVHFANSITGHLTGGLGLVAVVTSMFFAAISGSSAATVAAIGSILIPAMIKQGFDRHTAGSIQAAAGSIGVIIPPSVPIILYGVVTGTSISDLFFAGILPGLVIGLGLMITVVIIAKKIGVKSSQKVSRAESFTAFKQAILPILMPIIILGGIYGGVFTPTEAAAVAVFYAFLLGAVIYKEITWKNILNILKESVLLTSIVMFIIANAGLFGWIITRENIPATVTNFFMSLTTSPILFVIIINVLLLIVGMFMETSAATIILAPILTPVAMSMGIDPVHFGIIMIVNLALGMCTPPLGVNLFISCEIAQVKLLHLAKAMIPFFVSLIISLLIISFLPALSVWLPELLN